MDDEGHGRWRIAAAPGASLTVRYRVVSAYDHDPTAEDPDPQSRPIVRPRWFYASGDSLFAIPVGREDAPASFQWTGAPAGFPFASDLEHLAGPGRRALRPGVVGDVLESIAIGGPDVRLTGRLAPGATRVATVGLTRFTPEAFEQLTQRVITAERVFWRDRSKEPFLVTLATTQATALRNSTSGTGRGDAFAIWWDSDGALENASVLLGHEYFHTWNPPRIGGGAPDGSVSQAWFTEGFTDYYARALMLRAGILTPQQFAKLWNAQLLAYARSPVRAATNTEVTTDFRRSDAMRQLPYQRGAMLAAIWNARLRRSGDGLDAILREMPKTPGAGVAVRFPAAARRHGLDVQADIARYVERGEPLALPADAFGPCARVEQQTRLVYASGFDGPATLKAEGVVAGADPASNAYAAGLRDGMRIIARDFTPNDALKPMTLTVDDHGTQRVIRYLPAGATTEQVQQVRLLEPLAPACVRTLSGLPSG